MTKSLISLQNILHNNPHVFHHCFGESNDFYSVPRIQLMVDIYMVEFSILALAFAKYYDGIVY